MYSVKYEYVYISVCAHVDCNSSQNTRMMRVEYAGYGVKIIALSVSLFVSVFYYLGSVLSRLHYTIDTVLFANDRQHVIV